MHVVVVESPAKAKTINKYLGPDYTVLASYGHVRDLPSKDGSVLPNDDFAMIWETEAKGAARVKDIAAAMKGADSLILATDPDREGEAISWHLLEELTRRKAIKGMPVQRVTFNAITKDSVLKAMAAPRQIDQELVDAYLARRALDYLVGFTLSPLLWRKLPGSRSAGRVQSVALRLVVEREMEIERFKSQEYWSVGATTAGAAKVPFESRLVVLDGKKLAKLDLGSEGAAGAAVAAVKAGDFSVASVEAKPVKRAPPPPFTTSTLQQEASRKLGFSAQRTMQVAQKLYEGVDIGGETVGLITYMRTDGVSMDEAALQQLRGVIGSRFGKEYVPDAPRRYTAKAKNAQEAHEAIRPTDPNRHPGGLRLEPDMARLYDLIWKRAMASQLEAARLERTTIEMNDAKGRATLRATGQVVLFDGFFALYQEGRDEPSDDDDDARLPQVKVGEAISVSKVTPERHVTEPPPRYTEATLVKKMEELGIGRPSTYASVLQVLRDREYVAMDRQRFVPEDKGRLVTAFLENFFKRWVEYDFTADLEDQLDKVSAGELDYKKVLRDFWTAFSAQVAEMSELRIGAVIDAIDAALSTHVFPDKGDGVDPRVCPKCGEGRLSLRLGKNGAFVSCSNYPECRFTRAMVVAEGDEEGAGGLDGKVFGQHPVSGQDIVLKIGRFGPYVEMGDGEKPKRTSLPKGWKAEELTLESALKLLSLPRDVGAHPEDGVMIEAALGRFGPFIKHGKVFASLPGIEDAFDIGLNRAVTVLAEKLAGGGRPARTVAAALKELGESPVTGKPVRVLAGRFGAYVTDGETNATLPKGSIPEDMTAEEAITLLAARAALGPPKKGAKRKPAAKAATAKTATTKKPAAAKKPAAKEPAAKKAAPKKAAPKKVASA
jgi:DNA topoisomerase-1